MKTELIQFEATPPSINPAPFDWQQFIKFVNLFTAPAQINDVKIATPEYLQAIEAVRSVQGFVYNLSIEALEHQAPAHTAAYTWADGHTSAFNVDLYNLLGDMISDTGNVPALLIGSQEFAIYKADYFAETGHILTVGVC